MKLWDYLDKRDERRQAFKRAALELTGQPCGFFPTDFRGWLGLGLFLQSTFLFVLLAAVPDLMENQGFLTLASAVIVSGWVGGAAAFAYSAGKGNAERSEQVSAALRLAEQGGDGEPKPKAILAPGETAQAAPAPEA